MVLQLVILTVHVVLKGEYVCLQSHWNICLWWSCVSQYTVYHGSVKILWRPYLCCAIKRIKQRQIYYVRVSLFSYSGAFQNFLPFLKKKKRKTHKKVPALAPLVLFQWCELAAETGIKLESARWLVVSRVSQICNTAIWWSLKWVLSEFYLTSNPEGVSPS